MPTAAQFGPAGFKDVYRARYYPRWGFLRYRRVNFAPEIMYPPSLADAASIVVAR